MSRLSFVPFALLASISFAQTANPLVRITSPATAVVEISAPSIVLTGVASGGATKVHWVDQIGHRGNARLGNSIVDGGQNQVSWSTDAILLRPGTNQITVVVVDAQNHSSTATVAIVSSRSPSSLSLRPDIRTGVWRGQMVTYEVVNGLAIAAGDMILGTAEEVAAGSEIGNKAEAPKAGLVRRANSIDYTSLLWPRVGPVVQVPFTIQPGSASAAVANAVASFNASLSGFVQYVARGAEANYVTFNLSAADTSGACQSSVGMIGGQQFITGSGDCGVSTLVHEMGHSIGLYHEHQRTDNATFITANLANADKPLISGNFDAITSNQQNVGLYDFASVMQYPAFSFSKAGLPVLESIPAGIPLSNDVGFSLGDIDGIRRLYVYTPTQVTVTTNPPGLGIIVDGATLTAPQTFSWAIGSSHTLDLPADPQVTSPADGSTYMYGRWNDSVTRSHSVIVAAGAGFLTSPSSSPAVTLYEANFIRLQPFGTAVFPGGTGTVSPSPAPQSIFSGTFYRDRQQITLTATPNGANHFAGWFNVPFPQSENPKTYFIQSPTSSATGGFTSAAVTLFGASVTGPNPTNPGLFGTVDGNFQFLPQAFANDPNFGGAAWASGTSHTLAVSTPESPVTTNVRYLFSSWADAAPAVPSRSIVAPSSGVQSFTAVFNPVYRTFAQMSPFCGGTVNFSPTSPTADGFYADGSLLSVTAAPNPGISFGGWFGDLSGNTNPSNVTIHDQFIPGAFFNSTTTPISVTSFSPANTTVSAGAMDLIVTGTGFTASTQAFWNLNFRSSTFNSSTQITVHLTAGDLATAGGNRVSIQNVVNGCSLFVEGTFNITSASTVLGITKTHTGSFNVGQQNATYSITVNNAGTVPTSATPTVTDTLPTGLVFVSGSGNFWSCSAVAQVVTCNYSQVIGAGTNAQPLTITVNVATNAPVGTNSITNSATASGGGASNSPTATDPTTVLGPAVFSITKTHFGSFNVGQQNASYNISVSNGAGAGPTVGTPTVTDTLPTGLTYVSGIGNFWSCSAVAQVVTCNYSQVIPPGNNAQPLTITVNVASNAPVGTNSITNSATASGGGASNSPTATDPTTVLGPAVFSITKTHFGTFNVGQQNASYNISVSNGAAAGPTVGTPTVTDTLPTGLTYVSGIGNFWSCSAVAQVVTCNYSQVINPGTTAQPLAITVNVATNAPVGTNSITNSATASGGGASNSPTATDPTTVLGPAVFSITKTHFGTFNVGQQNASYNISVSNGAAAGPTVGTPTVTDTLPTGLTYVSGIGNFWSCSAVAQVVTCNYSQVIPPGNNAQPLTITVNVASNAPVGTNSITNSATASGGGASNSPTATDPTTVLGPAVFSITKTHFGTFNVGQQNASYSISVANGAGAGPTVGTPTVTDTLPTGLTYVSGIGNFWSCSAVAQVVTCNYSQVINPGTTAQPLAITVNVASNAPVGTNSITNSATVSGGGASNSPTATDPTTVVGPAVFTITKTHTGNFNVGQQNASYSISVANSAAGGPTVGTPTVTDTLPTGLTFVSGIGNFWSCSAVAQVVTCNYSQVIAPGTTAQPLAITVNVASNAPVGTNSITNSATASGGGASNSPTATDPTTILGPAVFTITKTHSGNFNVGQQNATYSISVANSAAGGPTVGSSTVTDTLPTGLTYVSGLGTFWSCSAVAQVVTCNYSQVINSGTTAQPLIITVNVANNVTVGTNTITNSVTASGGGASNTPTASDPTTIIAGPPTSMGLNPTTTPQSTAINTAFPVALAVTLKDVGNNPTPGINVTFTAPGAGASGKFSNNGTSIVVATDATGVASAPFTANATAGGPYNVTATSGALTAVNFSLTNTAAGTAPAITLNPSNVTVNAGQLATFNANASGAPGPTTQWQVSTDGGATFNDVPGATSATFSFTAASGQNGNRYRAVFTNASGSATTTAATLTVNFAPSVTTNPTSTSVSAGSTATFVAAASGNPTPTVQWQQSTDGGATFQNIAGATTTTLSFTALAIQNGNQYRAVFTNTVGSATTTAATLTVTAGPVITQNPTDSMVNAGQTATFTAAASGTPTPTVQWQFSTDGGATFQNVAGATTTTLTVPNVAAGQNGTKFRAVFTNGSGSATTTSATMTVNFAPSVTTNPTSASVSAGSPATFVAAASGNPTPTVQWQQSTDGGATFQNIAGATTTTLSFTALASQNGNQYRAVFTNTVGSATTTAATLTVTAGPVITQNPTDSMVNAGQTATFTAAASGTPTPTVQWQFSTDGGATFQNVAGATTTTLTVPNVAAGQNGTKFRAVFTNGSGSATTTAATMTVNFAPSVTTNPSSTSVSAGSPATFVAAASGNPTPTVQWQQSTDGGATFQNIAGATTTSLSFTALAGQNGTQYRAVFTNTVGSATTTAATLTVTAGPVITQNPTNATVNAGQTATFTAAASGTPTPTVQWQFSTDGGATFQNVAGATTTTLTVPNVAAGQNGTKFRAVFTNGSGSATTTAATMTVNFAPSVTTNPTSASVSAGSPATFVAAASGNPTPTVQWQQSTDGGATFQNIAGATTTTLSFTALASQNGNQYRAVFTNTVGSATTTAATLTVTAGPVITQNPTNATVNAGQTATFTAAASGTPTPTVQWQFSTDGGATFQNVAGATTTTLTVPNVAAGQNGTKFRAVFTNGSGSATTTAATMTVNFAPSVTTNPSSTSVSAGSPATFVAAASGNPTPTVQWQQSTDGGATFQNIAGATTTSLSFTALAGQNGTQYRAVFTNTVGSATTTAATLTVTAGPVITQNPTNQTVNAGQTATFTAAASGTPTPTVQWQFSTDGGATFQNVAGATTTTLTVPNVLAGQNGTKFRAVFTNGSGSATTTAATMTVNFAPTVTTNPTSISVSAASTATFLAAASGNPTPTVQWQISTNGGGTFANIAGATSTTLSFTAQASDNGNQYRAVFTNTVGSATTTAATLTISAATLQSIAVTPANPSSPKGTTRQFTATGTYSDNSTQNITAQVTWASATPSVATIAAGGLATAVGTGTSTISATLSGISGSTVLTVTAAALQSIAVTPANPSIPKGTTQQFTATGTFSDNSTQNLTAQVTWASATGSVATITAGGLATGVNTGTSTISATLSGISGSTVLTVTAAILQSIAVTPANPSIPKGSTQQFNATGTFSDSSTQNLTGTVTWASATTSVATIAAGGLATGVGTGTSNISATLSGVTGSTVLSVTAAVLQSIAVTPPNPSIAQGTTQQFTATGTFSDNSTQNLTGMVTWASATPSVATITTGGLASGVGTGTSLISATLGGITGSTVLTVTTGATGPTVVSFRVLFGTQSYNVTGSLRTRLPWQIGGIQVVFSAPITTADINSLTGLTTTGFSGLGTNTLTWTIAPIAQGALTASLQGSGPDAIKDAGGAPLGNGAGFNQNLKILWADFNDDGIVNASDLVLINNARLAAYTIFADLNGDGVVDINDVQLARTRNGTTLP